MNEGVSGIVGQRFAEIADLSNWYAVVLLDEQQIKFVNEDMYAKIRLYSEPHRIIESRVQSYGAADQSVRREKRSAFGPGDTSAPRLPDLVTEMVAANEQSKIQYFAKLPIESSNGEFSIGVGGQARLYTGYRSLGARVWWWINHNFRM